MLRAAAEWAGFSRAEQVSMLSQLQCGCAELNYPGAVYYLALRDW
jgi:hypothetical protein